jgi:Zn-dependent protease with chaperone function
MYEPEVANAEAGRAPSFQALKISGRHSGFMALFADHPPLEERIARLEHGTI